MSIDLAQKTSMTEQIPVLGLALMLCIIGSKFSKYLKIPTVTIYIVIGVFLGPTVFNFLNEDISKHLNFINQAALGLILFNIGGEFHRDVLKQLGNKQLKFCLLHAIFVFIIVAILFFSVTQLTGMTLTSSIITSLLLAAISLEAAPPTSLMVIKEFDAKGELTRSIIAFLGLGTLLAIILSQILILTYEQMGLWHLNPAPLWQDIAYLLWSIFGSILLGVGLAFLLGHWQQREKQAGELLLSVISFILFAQTISYYLKTDSLIISLALGMVLVNISNNGRDIHAGIKEMGLSVYAIFFVLAGSHIDLIVNLKSIGLLGLAYILIRIFAMIAGGAAAGFFFKNTQNFSKYLGTSLLCHAGAALAIVMQLKEIDQPEARQIVSIVTTSIFIFEILGPICLKWALKKAGEISADHALSKGRILKSQVTYEELWKNFTINTGLTKVKSPAETADLTPFVITEIIAIEDTAKLPKIKSFINESKGPVFPVVDRNYRYLGLISLQKLKLAQEITSTNLIMVKELIGNSIYIPQNATLKQVKEIFKTINMTVLPVVNEKSQKLIGIINYKDIVLSKKE